MNQYLPKDLLTFLDQGKELNFDHETTEVGRVTLKQIKDLAETDLYINSGAPPSKNADVDNGKSGYYAIKGVDLIETCDKSYDPHGILTWIPKLEIYATWDSDHYQLIGFPGINWSDITANPAKYLDAQWDPEIGGGKYIDGRGLGQFNN